MKYRKLRLAFSATCLAACALLIALSIRSREHADIWRGKIFNPFEAISVRGRLKLSKFESRYYGSANYFDTYPNGQREANTIENHLRNDSNYNGFGRFGNRSIFFPHWFAAALAMTFAAAPWIRPRFSLRTLLIATTLIAVALGALFALTR